MSQGVEITCMAPVELIHHNVLMSLPTSLVHCIVSEWLELVSVIRLDFALVTDKRTHMSLADILKSDQYYMQKVYRTKGMGFYEGPPPPEHLYTKIVSWLILRHVKVVEFKLHEHCWHVILEEYLQKFGKYVRHVCPQENYNRKWEERNAPTQNYLIAKYCHNLTGYSVNTHDQYDGNVLKILNHNSRLETFYIMHDLSGENHPSKIPSLTLPHLKQLEWAIKYGFGNTLVTIAKAAPNLQQMSLSCNPYKCTEIDGALILAVANACPNLRTFSCKELHIGRNDSFLKPFLAACSHIVNLDLNNHYDLTDTVLIAALSELHSLHSLDLRGCCRLTDKTLQFLAQRFGSTLEVLYLDHSEYPDIDEEEEEDEEGNPVPVVREVVQGGYTSAGIASLRTQCAHLHTYHYTIQAGTVAMPQHMEAYQNATIVQVRTKEQSILSNIAEHCQQLQILAMTHHRIYGGRVWLTVEQVTEIATRCPQLHTVVSERTSFCSSDKLKVDYSPVREAFPKLQFVEDTKVLDFNALEMPC